MQTPRADWAADLGADLRRRKLESAFIEATRARVTARAAEAPRDLDGFIDWFEALRDSGPGQWDPLFAWLETRATLNEMKRFLTPEAAGEAGFDGFVALTQVKLPAHPELGRRAEGGMHGPTLDRTLAGLGLCPTSTGRSGSRSAYPTP